jgi:hypothetical protein
MRSTQSKHDHREAGNACLCSCEQVSETFGWLLRALAADLRVIEPRDYIFSEVRPKKTLQWKPAAAMENLG